MAGGELVEDGRCTTCGLEVEDGHVCPPGFTVADDDALVDPMTYPLRSEQRTAIRQALGRMPYSGMVNLQGIETVEQLVQTLDMLAEVVSHYADRHRETATELAKLEAQRRAVRAFLGTATGLE